MIELGFIVGDIYRLKNTSSDVYLQVAMGQDVAVLSKLNFDRLNMSGVIILRVPIAVPALKKDWERIGNYPLISGLEKCGVYSEQDIGTEKYYKTSFCDPDDRVPATKDEASALEPLGVASTIHIVRRLEELEVDIDDWIHPDNC